MTVMTHDDVRAAVARALEVDQDFEAAIEVAARELHLDVGQVREIVRQESRLARQP